MNKEPDKEILQKLPEMKGEVRGVVFKTDGDFVFKKKGKEYLNKVEEELAKIGYPIKYDEIRAMNYYPFAWRVASLLVIKKVCGLDEEKIKEMGSDAPKISIIIKLFTPYFLSLARSIKETTKMWRKHYTFGNLVPGEMNEKEKFLTLYLKDFNIHPIFCSYLAGYFSTIIKMIVRSPVLSKEIKCFFKGDKYHEFLFTWR